MHLAVNGTLMKGLPANHILRKASGKYVGTRYTAPIYRLWSINNQYPGMIRAGISLSGSKIEVEIWEISKEGIINVLFQEPPGLSLGNIYLDETIWELF